MLGNNKTRQDSLIMSIEEKRQQQRFEKLPCFSTLKSSSKLTVPMSKHKFTNALHFKDQSLITLYIFILLDWKILEWSTPRLGLNYVHALASYTSHSRHWFNLARRQFFQGCKAWCSRNKSL